MDTPMTKTETSLARIFQICDEVAESGEPLRTGAEGKEAACAWLGVNNELTGASPVQRQFSE